MAKRLARLEEQVVTWFLVIANTPPVTVTFMLHCGRKAWQQRCHTSWHIRLLVWTCPEEIQSSSASYKTSLKSYLTLSYFVSSGCPVSQSPAVDYGRSEISGFRSKRRTLTELAPDSSPAISLNLHIFVIILHSVWFFPAAFTTADKSLDTYIGSPETKDGFHTKARQFHYPNSKITRFPVPEEKVPWEVFHILCQHQAASSWSSEHVLLF